MPRPLGQLRVLLSSRVLLDLEEADKVYREKGVQGYTDYLRCEGEFTGQGDTALGGFRRLNKGPMFDVALALSKLNVMSPDANNPLVELGLSCKDEHDSAEAIMRNLAVSDIGPALEWEVATNGHAVNASIHKAFKTDLFLTRSAADAQTAVDLGIASAVINFPPEGTYDFDGAGPVRIIVDGDAVAFGDSAEVGFRRDVAGNKDYGQAVLQYKEREHAEVDKLIEPGPFTVVLAKISAINKLFPPKEAPFEIGLLTARGGRATGRALATLRAHGVFFNYPSGFMGGADKGEWLEAHKPHLFLDDQITHLNRGMVFCPTGLVPYKTGGAMNLYQMELKNASPVFEAAAQGKAPVIEQDNVNRGPWPFPKSPDHQPG
ncbi:MAG: hypothetical protein JWO78_1161 [Micavibrio sp.]|nr:hypothetical protein [Micavibrio sp.]